MQMSKVYIHSVCSQHLRLWKEKMFILCCVFFPSHPERIHQAQAAAAKARKALQQKPKPASKPVGPLASIFNRNLYLAFILYARHCWSCAAAVDYECQALFMFQKSGSKDGGSKTPGSLEGGQDIGSNPMSPTPTTPTITTPGTPKSPLPCTATTPTKTGVPDTIKSSPGSVWHKTFFRLINTVQYMHPCFIRLFCIASALLCSSSVLLVSPPSLPQLGAILPSSQAAPTVSQPVTSQHAARIVSHLAAGSLPQVRVVSTQSGLVSSAGSQQATMVHQTPHQIRMPVSVAAKGISQVAKLSAFFFSFFFLLLCILWMYK